MEWLVSEAPKGATRHTVPTVPDTYYLLDVIMGALLSSVAQGDIFNEPRGARVVARGVSLSQGY